MKELFFSEERTFRQTPGVHFGDVHVKGANGLDLVEHFGQSISPPDRGETSQWYVHRHQTDNNRVIRGARLFELFNSSWHKKHWFVYLEEGVGSLQIPPGTFHRSYSGIDGSLLLNHAIRDEEYDETKEFIPCFCPAALEHPAFYHGITPWGAVTFINHGVYE